MLINFYNNKIRTFQNYFRKYRHRRIFFIIKEDSRCSCILEGFSVANFLLKNYCSLCILPLRLIYRCQY